MQSLREYFSDCSNWKEVAEKAKNRLIDRGYIYNEVYGWEKPKLLENFGLDTNMTAIPSTIITDKDRPGVKIKAANDRWLGYQGFKDLEDKKEYAKFKNLERMSENY